MTTPGPRTDTIHFVLVRVGISSSVSRVDELGQGPIQQVSLETKACPYKVVSAKECKDLDGFVVIMLIIYTTFRLRPS
jgi:hypothetical protein